MKGHGTSACGRRGCQQPECLHARYLQRKEGTLRRMRGIARQVPIGMVREVVQVRMVEHRLTTGQLAQAAGLKPVDIWRIQTLQNKHVRVSTYMALRDLPHLSEVRRKLLPAAGTVIRIRALGRAGYGVHDITRALGTRHPDHWERFNEVTRVRAEKVLAVTAELVRLAGPTPRAAQIARTKGWRAWDDFDQDLFWDVEWDGQGAVMGEALGPDLALEEFNYLREAGVSRQEAARRVGYNLTTLERHHYRKR